MTKITNLAFNRKFERTKEDINLHRRDKTIASFVRKIGMCPECEKPVYGSPGQILNNLNGVYTHKACRK